MINWELFWAAVTCIIIILFWLWWYDPNDIRTGSRKPERK